MCPLLRAPPFPAPLWAACVGERASHPLPASRTPPPWRLTPPCRTALVTYPGLLALQPPEEPEDKPPEAEDLLGVERTPSGRIRRTSAQVAVFHLQEIAEDELARDWTKRRMKDDLVPETARVSARSPSRPRLGMVPWGRPAPWPGASADLPRFRSPCRGHSRRPLVAAGVSSRLWPGRLGSPWRPPVAAAQLHPAGPAHTQPPAAGGVEERSQRKGPRQLPQ